MRSRKRSQLQHWYRNKLKTHEQKFVRALYNYKYEYLHICSLLKQYGNATLSFLYFCEGNTSLLTQVSSLWVLSRYWTWDWNPSARSDRCWWSAISGRTSWKKRPAAPCRSCPVVTRRWCTRRAVPAWSSCLEEVFRDVLLKKTHKGYWDSCLWDKPTPWRLWYCFSLR